MNNLAPIVLFVYNRLWHTKQTIEALQKNNLVTESELYIYSDAPKNKNDSFKVQEVRKYLKEINNFKKVTIIERTENLGLATSIISGVSEIVNIYGQIIVLEDDMVTSPYFLQYMNEALMHYKDENEVISIHGYMYPVMKKLPDTFFIKGADCWGWATWKRGWDLFEPDGNKLLQELKAKKLTYIFDYNGCYPYTKMLIDQIKGKNNSWAIRWYASAFLKNKYTLFPGKSLVNNIGFDNSGTHCESNNYFSVKILQENLNINKCTISENTYAKEVIASYLKPLNKNIFVITIVKRIKKVFIKLHNYQQFQPNFFGLFINPFYIARKGLYKSIKEVSSKISGKVLDVGCGQKPYIDLFKFESYIGMDIEQSGHNHVNESIDVFYDGKTFPFESHTFDTIICNEVFEHVFNPEDFIHEINRVLRTEGYFLISVPFMWIEHEQPYDYARYTSFGLVSILERNGFQIEKQMKTVNDVRSLLQLFSAYLYEKVLTKYSLLNVLISFIVFSPINIFGQLLFWIFPKSKEMYLDNVILAKKIS